MREYPHHYQVFACGKMQRPNALGWRYFSQCC